MKTLKDIITNKNTWATAFMFALLLTAIIYG